MSLSTSKGSTEVMETEGSSDDAEGNVLPNNNVDTSNFSTHSSGSSSDSMVIHREPFFAFVPQLAKFAVKLVGGEVQTAKSAITGFPAFTKSFSQSTYHYYRTNPRVLYDEIISGFTVAIMQVPESIAFSFVAGVPPLSGLHATFWMATITGLLGGKPGMISGAAGALAVVVTDLTIDDGVLSYLTIEQRLNVLYMTMFVCGLFQIGFAWLRLAKLVRLIPETGMIGFMNGLAIIIFMAQLTAFQKCDEYPLFVQCSVDQRQWLTFQDDTWVLVLGLVHVFITMLVMKFFVKTAIVGKIVPSSLVALLLGVFLEHILFRKAFGVSTRTVEETATMSGSLPKFHWPSIPNDSETVSTVLVYAVTLAAIGSVESVLTLQACNEITDTVPKVSDANQELFAQGLGNLVCGLFSAMGGDAMIGQSTINIMNGARHRVSSTMSGIFMLLFVVALSSFINLLPISTLTGVLFMVVLSTFQWKTFNILRYGRLSDSAVILLVTLVAVFFNLAVAIAAGIVLSAVVHVWDAGNLVSADIVHKRMLVNGEQCDVKYVHLKGSIFFGSARHFINMFSVKEDPDTVIIDFKDALIVDHSAVAAIQGITHRFSKVDKRVLLTNLPHKSHGRMTRTVDHEMYRQQLTSSDQLEHLDGDDEENQRQGKREEEEEGRDESVEVRYRSFQEIPMLQNPVETVDEELHRLIHDQGRVSVHGS